MKKQSLNALAASYRADLLYYIERAKLGKCPPHWQAYCFGEIAAAKGTDAYPEDGDALLDELGRYVQAPAYGKDFGARVYKIARDEKGARLTFLKVTGGTLGVKQLLAGEDWQEKADQLRLYSGSKFTLLQEASAWTVCAVIGLT